MKYKNYTATIQYSEDDNLFFGKVDFINDLITFEGNSIKILEESFHKSVDDYLDMCKNINKSPNKEFKGTFNIRISPVLHKKLVLQASKDAKSLNKLVEQKLEASF